MNPLIPIALSSQLDVTGEERIHAAPYTPIVRPTWTPVPYQYFVYQSTFSTASDTFNGYGRVNLDTYVYEDLGEIDVPDSLNANGDPAMNIGGDLIIASPYSYPAETSGVYAFRYNAPGFTQHAFWRDTTGSDTNADQYNSIAQIDEEHLAVCVKKWDINLSYLIVLNYDGNTFTEVDKQVIHAGSANTETVIVHNGFLITVGFSGTRRLKAFSFGGSAINEIATYGGTVSTRFGQGPKEMQSDGTYIYLSNGQIFTFDGTTFTLVATAFESGTTPYSAKFAISPGAVFYAYSSGLTINRHSFDGTNVPLVGTFENDVRPQGWMRAKDGLLWLPIPSHAFFDTADSGLFTISGTSLTKVGDLRLPVGDTRVSTGISFIEPLTEH